VLAQAPALSLCGTVPAAASGHRPPLQTTVCGHLVRLKTGRRAGTGWSTREPQFPAATQFSARRNSGSVAACSIRIAGPNRWPPPTEPSSHRPPAGSDPPMTWLSAGCWARSAISPDNAGLAGAQHVPDRRRISRCPPHRRRPSSLRRLRRHSVRYDPETSENSDHARPPTPPARPHRASRHRRDITLRELLLTGRFAIAATAAPLPCPTFPNSSPLPETAPVTRNASPSQ
jgi:hypothetical protein